MFFAREHRLWVSKQTHKKETQQLIRKDQKNEGRTTSSGREEECKRPFSTFVRVLFLIM